MPPLGPDTAYIFRITHVDNVPWILDNGLHCRNSKTIDRNFVPIGSQDLIDKRSGHAVTIPPGGTLSDYVPFYFTPYSMMLYNITTGYGGVIKRANKEVAILVSSLHKAGEANTKYLFTDGHAYMQGTTFYDDLAHLGKIDWDLLRRKDFKKSPTDLDKSRRYQAEALVHKHLPVGALLGVSCYDRGSADRVDAEVARRGLTIPVKALPDWYF